MLHIAIMGPVSALRASLPPDIEDDPVDYGPEYDSKVTAPTIAF